MNGSTTAGRALIVDDNPVNLRLLRRILTSNGYEVIEASGGVEAIEKARESGADIVLLDIVMPDIDGYEVCRVLKQDGATADIPIIFLSALDEAADKVKGLELGASDYITKPFNQWEVLARVRSHVRLRQLTASLIALNHELLAKQELIDEDLHSAGEVQRTLLPREKLNVPGVHVRWRFQPSIAIGGDIFNVFCLREGLVGAYIADVSGHGVSSAMVTVSVAQTLNRESQRVAAGELPDSPAELLRLLDREYPLERFSGRYFTMCLLLLDTQSGVLRYCVAGHPAPILNRASGELELLEEGGPVVGMGFRVPFEEGRRQLGKGDRIILYTDGITESETPEGELFGLERLQSVVASSRNASLEELCDGIVARVKQFGTGDAKDDIALLAIEVT